MEMPTIEMPRAEARKLFLEYRHAVRERHNAEDEMIMRGYRALSQGHQVINLLDVMKAGGVDEQGRPKFAIARAHMKRITMRRWSSGAVMFDAAGKLHQQRSTDRTSFPTRTLPQAELQARNWQGEVVTTTWIEATAIVPNIPPALRPAHALSNYHILWEAEWTAIAPRDPALLRHAGGWLYVVLATWELTALEQAVLGLTRN